MPYPENLREEASRCRRLAKTADERTAANLRMLAENYEAEAERLQAEATPPAAEQPGP